MKFNLITILGPTATGKTALAAPLADKYNGEIISADSRQVYRGMDIGTGKDLKDYNINGQAIPYHLIDIVDPGDEFDLFSYQKSFYSAYNDIRSRKKIPLLTGGTGMYLSSVIQNYELRETDFNSPRAKELSVTNTTKLKEILTKLNPELHNTTDLNDRERIIKAILVAENKGALPEHKLTINSFNIGVTVSPEIQHKRITTRLKSRLEEGMIDEVKTLLDNGISHEKLQFFGLEYKFVSMYLKGEINYNDMYQKLRSAIIQFAKRQRTWFRKMEKEGIKIFWLDGPDFTAANELIKKNLHNFDFANDFPSR